MTLCRNTGIMKIDDQTKEGWRGSMKHLVINTGAWWKWTEKRALEYHWNWMEHLSGRWTKSVQSWYHYRWIEGKNWRWNVNEIHCDRKMRPTSDCLVDCLSMRKGRDRIVVSQSIEFSIHSFLIPEEGESHTRAIFSLPLRHWKVNLSLDDVFKMSSSVNMPRKCNHHSGICGTLARMFLEWMISVTNDL